MNNCSECKGTGLGDDSGFGDYGPCADCGGSGVQRPKRDSSKDELKMAGVSWLFEHRWITYDDVQRVRAAIEKEEV